MELRIKNGNYKVKMRVSLLALAKMSREQRDNVINLFTNLSTGKQVEHHVTPPAPVEEPVTPKDPGVSSINDFDEGDPMTKSDPTETPPARIETDEATVPSTSQEDGVVVTDKNSFGPLISLPRLAVPGEEEKNKGAQKKKGDEMMSLRDKTMNHVIKNGVNFKFKEVNGAFTVEKEEVAEEDKTEEGSLLEEESDGVVVEEEVPFQNFSKW